MSYKFFETSWLTDKCRVSPVTYVMYVTHHKSLKLDGIFESKNIIRDIQINKGLTFLYSPIIKQQNLIIQNKIMPSTMLLTWNFALLPYFWEIIMPVVSYEMFITDYRV